MALDMSCESLLVFLGRSNELERFSKPEFLHERFFRHCKTRDEYADVVTRHRNIIENIDIYIPHNALDLIYQDGQLQGSKAKFHVYCVTDDLVSSYQNLVPSEVRSRVFHIHDIESKMYKSALMHVAHSFSDSEKRFDEGDIDAEGLTHTMGHLLEQLSIWINRNVQQKLCSSEQPAEYERE